MEEEYVDEGKILDTETWKGSKEKLSYKDLVLKQVARMTAIGSRELTHGWWKKSLTSGGAEINVAYIGDGRDDYIRGVEMLHDLLLPKFDEKMQKKSEELNTEAEEIHEKWLKKDSEGYDRAKDKYLGEKLVIMRKMFQALCIFLEKLGWLEAGVTEE